MKRHIFFIAALLLTAAFLAKPPAATAQSAASQVPPPVAAAETYLNRLSTAKARFVQTAQNGAQVIGNFYLSRPGRLRFEYDPPLRDFIVADGFLIYFYDSELGEQTNAPIGQTLADFLLRDNLRLSGDVKVTDIARGNGLMQITLTQTADPEAGSLTLGFTENPLALKKWRVTDSTGAITEIELFKLETGLDLDSELFVYSDPDRFGAGAVRKYND